MNLFVEQYQEDVIGVLSCFDQVIVTGTLPDICHPKAMAGFLGAHDIRLFDYALCAAPLREELRVNAEQIATEAGLKIDFIRGGGVSWSLGPITIYCARRSLPPTPFRLFSQQLNEGTFRAMLPQDFLGVIVDLQR